MLMFSVTGAAVGKGRPRFVRATGRAYTPEKTRSYEALVRSFAIAAMEAQNVDPFMDGPVEVLLFAHLARPKSMTKKLARLATYDMIVPSRPDLDQIIKSILDGMNGVVFRDDSQVARLVAWKGYVKPGELPSVKVTVTRPTGYWAFHGEGERLGNGSETSDTGAL